MHIHRFKINELERNTRPGRYHHLRRFLTVYRGAGDEDRKLFAGHIETIVQKPRAAFAFRFHVGTAGSETPFDGHLLIFGTGFYWGIENGRKLADRLTKEKTHKYEGRDLRIALDGEGRRFYWQLWTHPSRLERGEFARWREGSFRTSPLDIIFGQKRYWYEDGEWALIAITMPEGNYAVRATQQRQLYGRPKLKRRIESPVLSVVTPKGIPTHFDKSGGWKGDRTYGFSVPFTRRYPENADWVIDAENAITGWVFTRRAQGGFREAQEVDA